MMENIEKITGEIAALTAELAELAKEGREAEIASRLSKTKIRWVEEALQDRKLAEEFDGYDYEYPEWYRRLAVGDMDRRTDEEIKDLVRAAKTSGLTCDAACDAVIGRFFYTLDEDWNPVKIEPDHWWADRVRQLAMEVYQPRQPAADKFEEER